MKTFVGILLRIVVVLCLVTGTAIIFKNYAIDKKAQVVEVEKNPKVAALKKYISGFNKPARIEVIDLTQKYAADVNEIKQMKTALDSKSNFYIKIQFFTDETDATAPLVAQIKFIDVKSDNLIKEESINLE